MTMMEQWAQKPDKTCEFYLRVVNAYISFSNEKNSLLHTPTHNLITFCTSTPTELDQRLSLRNKNSY